MLFPIIKIKDGDFEHIVGSNYHDCLYVKDNSIHYLNVQGMVGSEDKENNINFVAEDKGEYSFSGYPEIEFMTLEQIIELAKDTLTEQTENTIKFYEMTKKLCEEKLSKCKKETGIKHDTSGSTY